MTIARFFSNPVVRDWLLDRAYSDIVDQFHAACTVPAPLILTSFFGARDVTTAFRASGNAWPMHLIMSPVKQHSQFLLLNGISEPRPLEPTGTITGAAATTSTSDQFSAPKHLTSADAARLYVRRGAIDLAAKGVVGIGFSWLTEDTGVMVVDHLGAHGIARSEIYHVSFRDSCAAPMVLSATFAQDDGKCQYCWTRGVSCQCPMSFRNRTELAVVSPSPNFIALAEQYIHLKNGSLSRRTFVHYNGVHGDLASLSFEREFQRLSVREESGAFRVIEPAASGHFYTRTAVTLKRDTIFGHLRQHLQVLCGPASEPGIDNVLFTTITTGGTAKQRKRTRIEVFEPEPATAAALRRRPVCELCGTTFSNRGNFKRHMISSHGNAPLWYCPHCSYTCKQKSDHVRHQRVHMKSAQLLIQQKESASAAHYDTKSRQAERQTCSL